MTRLEFIFRWRELEPVIQPAVRQAAALFRKAVLALVVEEADAGFGRGLAGAVEIHEHQLTMVHAKVIVADGSVTCVGSINFDPRSFALNAECGAVMLDDLHADTVARGLEECFTMADDRRAALGQASRRCYDQHLTLAHLWREHTAVYDRAGAGQYARTDA